MRSKLILAIALALNPWSTTGEAAETYYDGSRSAFLAYLSEQWPTEGPLPEWSAQGVIGTFKARDGVSLRYAYLPRASAAVDQGTVVHFNGRTEFIERNALSYRDLAERGWDVWTFDWRGQGLSERPLTGDRSVRGHIESFDSYVDDAKIFIDGIVKLKSRQHPHVLLAHSMGGQVALRYLLDNPKQFDVAVLISPLVRLPDWGTRFIATLKDAVPEELQDAGACAGGKSAEWHGSFTRKACELLPALTAPQLSEPETTEGYTHDRRNLAIGECLIERSRGLGHDPGLAVSCPTAGWLVAAHQSIKTLFKKKDALAKIPILIVAAENDPAVDPEGQKTLCDGLSNCMLIQVPFAGHELLVEIPSVRTLFFGCFDAFVANPKAGISSCQALLTTFRPDWSP